MKLLLLSAITLFINTIGFSQKTIVFEIDSTKSLYPHNLIRTTDNNFIISGEAYNFSHAIENYPDYHYVVKFDLNGDTIWTGLYDLDWYANGKIVETSENYQIMYTGDGSFSCNGWGMTFPFSKIKSRVIDFEGKEISIQNQYNPECSSSIIHHQTFQDENIFLSRHITSQSADYLGITHLDSDGNTSVTPINIDGDRRYASFIKDTSLFIVGPKNIFHLNLSGETIKSFDFDSVRYEETVRVFYTTNQDSLIIFYCSYDFSSRHAVIRTMDFEGNLGKEKIISGFRYYNVIKTNDGQFLLAGQDSNNDMAVILINQSLDSITTKHYPQNMSSTASDILMLEDNSFMLSGRLGNTRELSKYIVIIDSLSVSSNINANKVLDNTTLIVYPNPNNGKFNIQITNGKLPVDVKIYDSLGREVYSNPSLNNSKLNLTHLIDGTYTIRTIGENEINTNYLVIRRE